MSFHAQRWTRKLAELKDAGNKMQPGNGPKPTKTLQNERFLPKNIGKRPIYDT
jgi:hypothetical protein